ncbi:MAG: hypothetical protein HPY79_11560 [Bacteroidales bacterium]|nr:hypothetical protein [Bacteroidales bacterium]
MIYIALMRIFANMLSDTIKNQIESVYGQKIRYPKDCDALASEISSKTGCQISVSTVKRLFGFIKTTSNPNQYTLDTIAIYLGYASWQEFSNKVIFESVISEPNDFISKQKRKRLVNRKIIFGGIGIIILTGLIIGAVLFKNYYFATKTVKYSILKKMPEPRAGGKTVVLDKSVYYIGGFNCALMANNNWEYNSSTNSWKEHAPMPTKRAEMATALVDGKIYCFGGWLGNNIGMTDVAEVYDIKEDKWDSLPKLPVKITAANAVSVGNDIYILGGTIGETNTYFFRFNTLTQIYEALPLFNMAMMHSCMVLVNNKIYVMGGQSYMKFEYRWHNNVYAFDISTKEWTEKAPIPIPISSCFGVFLNNEIHLLGGKDKYGNDNSGLKDTHFVYDVKNNKWKIEEKLPYTVCEQQVVQINGKIILIGGNYDFPNPTDKVISF